MMKKVNSPLDSQEKVKVAGQARALQLLLAVFYSSQFFKLMMISFSRDTRFGIVLPCLPARVRHHSQSR
jgi:hypothetical protein